MGNPVSLHQIARRRVLNIFQSGFFHAPWRYAVELMRMYRAARTMRLLNSLPDELCKDIGWPDRFLEDLDSQRRAMSADASSNHYGAMPEPGDLESESPRIRLVKPARTNVEQILPSS